MSASVPSTSAPAEYASSSAAVSPWERCDAGDQALALRSMFERSLQSITITLDRSQADVRRICRKLISASTAHSYASSNSPRLHNVAVSSNKLSTYSSLMDTVPLAHSGSSRETALRAKEHA